MAFVGKVRARGNTGPVGSTLYGTCDTAAGVATKVANNVSDNIAQLNALMVGLTIRIKFAKANTAANPTLTIPSVDSVARPIYLYRNQYAGSGAANSWHDEEVVTLTYDGNAWQMNGWQANTTYSNATTSAAGLMSAADKLTLDNISAKRTMSLAFQNVLTTTWTKENPATYASYPYKATIACPGVTAAHFAQVCFEPEDVVSYVPASVCQTGSNVVTVWMMIDPGKSLTVPTVFAILPDRT